MDRMICLGWLVLGGAIIVALPSSSAAPITNLPHPFSTNVAGQYVIDRPFVGESKVTVRSGFFATHLDAPELQKIKRELRFDLFTLNFAPSGFYNGGTHMISGSLGWTTNGWRHRGLRSYRSTLPTDSAIKDCTTVPALTNLLGEAHIVDGPAFFATWSFFTFTSTNSIETLSVSCSADWLDRRIGGLEIRRGIAKQSR